MAEAGPPPAAGGSSEGPWRLQHHALRQPLNALGLFCEALKMQPLTPAQRPLVAGIADAAVSIERLVDEHFAILRGGSSDRESAPGADLEADLGAGPVSHLATQAVAAAGPSPGGETAGVWLEAPRIVVVDDDHAARTGLMLLLEAWGAAVEPFAGIEPLGRWLLEARDAPPDLLILDYHLPRPGDGLQALRLMREAWPGRTVPALLITGDERAAVSNALTDGSLECLVKPVTPGPLLAALRQQLGGRFSAQTGPRIGAHLSA